MRLRSTHGAFPQPDAHGIVGQSYRNETVRNGKMDDYDLEISPEKADAEGMLPPFTTSAQAEGAIDGVYSDYRLPHPLMTDFTFSRFERAIQAPQVVAKLERRTASSSEYDGDSREWAARHLTSKKEL